MVGNGNRKLSSLAYCARHTTGVHPCLSRFEGSFHAKYSCSRQWQLVRSRYGLAAQRILRRHFSALEVNPLNSQSLTTEFLRDLIRTNSGPEFRIHIQGAPTAGASISKGVRKWPPTIYPKPCSTIGRVAKQKRSTARRSRNRPMELSS